MTEQLAMEIYGCRWLRRVGFFVSWGACGKGSFDAPQLELALEVGPRVSEGKVSCGIWLVCEAVGKSEFALTIATFANRIFREANPSIK